MQEKKAIRLGWWYDHIYISRPSSWYDRVMLDSERNELIFFLLDKKGFECENKLSYMKNGLETIVPKFYWGTSIDSVTGKIGEYDTEFKFDNQGTFSIQFKLGGNNWKLLDGFENEIADENTVSRLEEKIFAEKVFEELAMKTLLSETNTVDVS